MEGSAGSADGSGDDDRGDASGGGAVDRYKLGDLWIYNVDEWLWRISALTAGDWLSWSLRELLSRFEAVQYDRTRRVSELVAALYNVQRTQRSDPVYTFLDFHPIHQRPAVAGGGRQKLQRIAAMMAPGMIWDEAQRPEGL